MMRKTGPERTIEALTWAGVVMWLGFSLIMLRPVQDYVWLIVMVLGIILLSSAIYQRSRGWQTSMMIWIAGVWMAVFSVIELVDEIIRAISTSGDGLQIDLWVYLGIALISMGLAVVLKNLHVPTPTTGRTGYTEQRTSRYSQTSQAPRRVEEDLSSAYLPPTTTTSRAPSARRARPADSGRTSNLPAPEPRRTASRPAQEPADLETRVEDIIRRSRERRDRDNLPY
jgi:hypothetical protein